MARDDNERLFNGSAAYQLYSDFESTAAPEIQHPDLPQERPPAQKGSPGQGQNRRVSRGCGGTAGRDLYADSGGFRLCAALRGLGRSELPPE